MNLNAAANQNLRCAMHAYWSSEWSFVEDEPVSGQGAVENQRLESMEAGSTLMRPEPGCISG